MAKANKGNTTTTTSAAPSLLTDSTQGATTDATTQNGTGTTQDSAAPKKADICREAAAAGCSTLKQAQEWAAERYPGVSLSQSNWWAATRTGNGSGGEKQKGGGIMPADLLTLSALMGKLGGIEPVEQLADILSRNSIDGLRETLDVLAQLTGAAKK